MADDFRGDELTDGRVLVNGPGVNGNIETAGDHDWFQVWLWAGHTYAIKEDGSAVNSGNTLSDTVVALHGSDGFAPTKLLATNNDGGVNDSSYLRFQPWYTGQYWVDASAFSNGTGTYQIHVDQQAGRLSAPNVWMTGATSSDRLIDFNGDGKDDLLQIGTDGTIKVAISSSDGSGFVGYHMVGSGASVTDQAGEFDGFGGTDVLQIYNGKAYWPRPMVLS